MTERWRPGFDTSVKDIINAASKVTGQRIISKNYPRRNGDPDILVVDPALVQKTLNWNAKNSYLRQIVLDAWNCHKIRFK